MRVSTTALATMAFIAVCAAPALAQRPAVSSSVNTGVISAARVGVLGGGGATWVSTSERLYDMSYRTGWSAGVYGLIPLSETLGFRAEGVYSRKGVVLTLPHPAAGGIPVKYATHYIEAPLLLQYSIPVDWLGIRPFLVGGASPAYLISRTYQPGGVTPPTDRTDASKRFDVGILLGGGAAMSSSFGILELNARATFGLRDLREQAKEDELIGAGELRGNNHTRSVMIMVGYSLPLSMIPGLD